MTPSDSDNERQRIDQAIAAQENLRGTVDDVIIDATIAALKEKLAALDSHPEQQRKLASILFMDIADHTALTRGMDPEDQMALIDPLIARLAEKVTEFGGHVARFQGDGFKSVFGLPVSRENDPEQAIRAGLAIQDEAAQIESELESDQGIEVFKVRVGLTTGQVFSGGDTEGEDTIKGPPVNLASRLESAAHPGMVLISYDTYKHVRGIFTFELLQPLQVKGFSDPVQVYQVQSAKPRAFYRGMRLVEGVETRMIGREAELETLKDAYYTVVEDGEPQIVTIIGEAGLGKSRLLYEFENWVDLQPAQVRLYRGRAHLESQRLPYDLLRSIFAFRFNIQDDDPLEIVKEKWLKGLSEVQDKSQQGLTTETNKDIEMQAHILGQLLGYDFADSPHVKPLLGEPQQIRDRSMVYLEDYFKAITSKTAVMILLEDLHWADDSSLDALSRLGLELRETPILIVSAARPRLYERRPYWFEGHDFHRRVDLKPLSKRLNRQLVAEILQFVSEIPESLSELILTNAEGNPFYMEELVKVLVEAGVILKEDPYWLVDEEQLEKSDVPSTLTGVLQARLERLSKDERTLIQQASVVGRVFWDQAVWYLNHQGNDDLDEADIQDGLVNLRGREMIYHRELSAFLDAKEYIFKHAVLREVTYESVLKKLRRAYHNLTAEWLMEQRGDRSGEVVGLIADHLELAGEEEEALRYLRWAGEAAAERYANHEACEYFSRALILVPEENPETRFDLLLAREEVLELQGKREAQRLDLKALETLADKLGAAEKQLEVGVRWSNYFWVTNDFQAAADTAEAVVVLADGSENLQLASEGHLQWGRALIMERQYDIARQHLEQALTGFQSIGDQRMVGLTLRSLGLLAANLFNLPVWQDYSQQALTIARQIGDRSAEAEAINHLGSVSSRLGIYQTSQKYYGEYLLIAREIGSRDKERMALGNLGEVANAIENYPAGLDYYKNALTVAKSLDHILGMAMVLNGIGKAQAGLEDWEAASQSYQQAMDLYADFGADWGIAETRIGFTQIALAQDDQETALAHVNAVMDYLETDNILAYAVGPSEGYLTCYKVLQAAGDPRASGMIEKGYSEMLEQVTNLDDEELLNSYLENVPWNRELVRLWEEQQLD